MLRGPGGTFTDAAHIVVMWCLHIMIAYRQDNWAPTRHEAIARMRHALDECVIEGINTTIDLHKAFIRR